MLTVAFIGGFTAIFAASMGLVTTDIKRVMAFSTVSQLGYMMLALGSGAEGAGAFHLFTHAFFKALLFLTAGSVIYALHRAGAARRYVETRTAPRSCRPGHARDGRPAHADADHLLDDGDRRRCRWRVSRRSSGFWSKDEILLATLHAAPDDGGALLAAAGFALITVFMTAFYMFRVIFMTFGGTFRGADGSAAHPRGAADDDAAAADPGGAGDRWSGCGVRRCFGNGFARFLEGPEFHAEEMNFVLAGARHGAGAGRDRAGLGHVLRSQV